MQVLSVPSNVVMVRNDVVLNFFCLVTWIYDKCTVAQLHSLIAGAALLSQVCMPICSRGA